MSDYPAPPPPPSSISVNIQLNYEDYRRAFYQHTGAARYIWILLAAAPILWSLSVPAAASNIGLRVGLIAAGIVLLFIFPFLLRKQFRANKRLAQPFSITASENGIESNSEYGSSQMKWSTFIQFAEDKYAVLLYSQPGLYLIFPKRLFAPDQLAEFARLVRANVQPRARKKASLKYNIFFWILIAIAAILLIIVIKQGK